jgi:hypothetical protein
LYSRNTRALDKTEWAYFIGEAMQKLKKERRRSMRGR